MSIKLDPKLKAEWVAALRSGKYEQGTSFLNRDNKFCCLGVLCDLIKDEVGGQWIDKAADGIKSFQIGASDSHVSIPYDRKGWYTAYNSIGVTIEGEHRSLWNHNDGVSGKAHTFIEIAKAIEEQL